ncbi:hypothetical protein JMK10_00135 [Rhodovulum sulfidophilum]|uniref:hypothetical protein n=1 Tax=Rhodovulum sulfidophilum TaxID=35806 RepID=UPI001920A1E2|nr:hypothetical protein [Rhodovulum sulfidophilum]MBL3576136.1 hypothetical protein [Rhodovulum sulfidophilum]MCE8432967.1 hypothetical protein [Rhodovulum sulfidophilum]MCF4115271.1 hypothetical protein [Rhodovulum sulfidophilum]
MEEGVEITSFRYQDRSDKDLPPVMMVKFWTNTQGAIERTAESAEGHVAIDLAPSADYATMEREALMEVARYLRQVADYAESSARKR